MVEYLKCFGGDHISRQTTESLTDALLTMFPVPLCLTLTVIHHYFKHFGYVIYVAGL